MSVERIDYDLFRNLLRDVLGDVAANGLPGRHHFYITFNTAAEGVQISDRLREKFPEQMTIVLQHHSYRRILVTSEVRRQRLELAI